MITASALDAIGFKLEAIETGMNETTVRQRTRMSQRACNSRDGRVSGVVGSSNVRSHGIRNLHARFLRLKEFAEFHRHKARFHRFEAFAKFYRHKAGFHRLEAFAGFHRLEIFAGFHMFMTLRILTRTVKIIVTVVT